MSMFFKTAEEKAEVARQKIAAAQERLFEAAKYGDIGAMQKAIKKGASVNVQNDAGKTPLHIAISPDNYSDYAECVKFLLSCKPDFSLCDKDGKTALMAACYKGLLWLVEATLDAGADPNISNCKDLTPLLISSPARNWPIVRKLVEAGADTGATDAHGWTALHYAAHEGENDVVALLIEKGASLNAVSQERGAPLAIACEEKRWHVAQRLIEAGADPRFVGRSGKPPLILACKEEKWHIVRLLVEVGADLRSVDSSNGYTALHYAASKGQGDLVALMLEKGADPAATDKRMETAADVAAGKIKDFLHEKMGVPQQADPVDAKPVASVWRVTEPGEIARVSEKAVIGYRITEIFNFNARVYTYIGHNIETKAETHVIKPFSELNGSALIDDAHRELLARDKTAGVLDKPKMVLPALSS